LTVLLVVQLNNMIPP